MAWDLGGNWTTELQRMRLGCRLYRASTSCCRPYRAKPLVTRLRPRCSAR